MPRPTHPFEVTHKAIWTIALPATFAFVTEPLAGLVDLAVVGRLGDAALLGGLVLGVLIFDIIFALLFFVRLGTSGLVAQAFGARDEPLALAHFSRAILVSLVLGGLCIVLTPLIEWLSLRILAPEPEVLPAFSAYLGVRIWSAPMVLINYALLGWFYGRAQATTGLLLQVVVHVGNMILSVCFVHGLGWGVAGVAFGTVLAQSLAAFIGLYLVARHFGGWRTILTLVPRETLFDLPALRKLFGLSRDIMIRSGALMFSFAYFTAQTSREGTLELSANAIVLNFMIATAYLQDGQAQAAEQICGKAVGANYRPAFEQANRLTLIWGYIVSAFLFAIWMLAGPSLIDLMTTVPEVRELARSYLFIAALIAITGVMPFIYDGIMIGSTMNKAMRNGMLIALPLYLVAAQILQPLFGIMGLWAALHVLFILRGLIYFVFVERQKASLFDA